MGWISYRATHYTKTGQVDKKAECDARFEEGVAEGNCCILKSRMIGNTYYAAIKQLKAYRGEDENGKSIYEDLTIPEQEVYAVVILTSVDNNEYCNFAYKLIDETMGPFETKCPISILTLLTPTNNKYALEWRERCSKNANKEKKLKALSVGTKIRISNRGRKGDKQTIVLQKMQPAYSFKTPWWKVMGENAYCNYSDIPIDFEVLPDNKYEIHV